jgi:hypothetical protein
MPVTADSYFPFDAGAGADVAEAEWRKMARHWAADGVLVTGVDPGDRPDKLAVSAGTGLQVLVEAGEAWVQGHYAEWESQEALTVASNSSGSTRIDVVVVRADFVNNDIELDIVAGTPGAGAPSLTENTSTWEIPLAQYTVTNGASAPTSFVDRRTFSEAGATQIEVRLRRTTGVSIAPGFSTDVTWDTEDSDPWGFWSSGSNLTVPSGAAGTYLVTVLADPLGSATAIAGVQLNGANVAFVEAYADGAGVPCTLLIRLVVGDIIEGVFVNKAGGSTTTFTGSMTMVRVAA